jgi:hypothetical protein
METPQLVDLTTGETRKLPIPTETSDDIPESEVDSDNDQVRIRRNFDFDDVTSN